MADEKKYKNLKMANFYYFFRKTYNKIILFLIFLLSLLAVLPFFYIAYFVFKKGFSAINWNFFTKLPAGPGAMEAGLANGILGSLIMVGLACLIGLPWGCFLGVFLSEYRFHPLSKLLRFVIDLSISTPSIVLGIFVYSLLVSFFGFSAYAGALALMLILIPIVGKSTEEILKMVPNHIREAGLALGLPRWKVILQILIPGTFTMLFSGVILSIARVAGETAPLLFTSLGNQFFSNSLSEPTASLPVQIYEFSKSGFPDLEAMAWGGAFLLISFVFFINFSVRLLIFIKSANYKNDI